MGSKAEIDAVSRDYLVKPRLEYRTVIGVNGPLVILDVSSDAISPQLSLLGSSRLQRFLMLSVSVCMRARCKPVPSDTFRPRSQTPRPCELFPMRIR
eukprot:1870229-Pleurochrysis_carterae.AAC.2